MHNKNQKRQIKVRQLFVWSIIMKAKKKKIQIQIPYKRKVPRVNIYELNALLPGPVYKPGNIWFPCMALNILVHFQSLNNKFQEPR